MVEARGECTLDDFVEAMILRFSLQRLLPGLVILQRGKIEHAREATAKRNGEACAQVNGYDCESSAGFSPPRM